MNKSTHYLTLAIGVDFSQMFTPERINGVKYMLGVESDEDVINVMADRILKDIDLAIGKMDGLATIAEANIKPAEELEPHVEHESTDELIEDDVFENKEKIDDEIEQEVESVEEEVSEELAVGTEPDTELLENIVDDVFMIHTRMGEDVNVYLGEYDMYEKVLSGILPEYVDVGSLKELSKDVIDISGKEDYVIEYTDVGGEVKYAKRELDKNIEEENI